MKPRQVTPRLTGHLEVSTDLGAFLGDKRVRLLEAIDLYGSISQAAKHVPLSYKAAWDAVDAMNNLADTPLVERSTGGKAGGGTLLTEHGRRVIALYRAVEAEYQSALDRLAKTFASEPVGDVHAFQRLLRRMSFQCAQSVRRHRQRPARGTGRLRGAGADRRTPGTGGRGHP